jgi:hypothetical protein
MNVTSFSRNAMLVLLLSCPVAKAGFQLNDLLNTDNLKHLLTAGLAGFIAKTADDKVKATEKVSGGRANSSNLNNIVRNAAYSVSKDGNLADGKSWIKHGASAVVTEAALSTSVGHSIVSNTPVLGSLYESHKSLASFLVYLGVDSLLSPELAKRL